MTVRPPTMAIITPGSMTELVWYGLTYAMAFAPLSLNYRIMDQASTTLARKKLENNHFV